MLYRIDPDRCVNCGSCRRHCPFDAVVYQMRHQIDPERCTGCTLCYIVCPVNDDDKVIVPVPVGRIVEIPRHKKRQLRRALLKSLDVMKRNWDPLEDEMPPFDAARAWADHA